VNAAEGATRSETLRQKNGKQTVGAKVRRTSMVSGERLGIFSK
jgi:hypothetical protein